MEKHFKKHIEEDQQQLLAEARGAPGMRAGNAGRNSTKGTNWTLKEHYSLFLPFKKNK